MTTTYATNSAANSAVRYLQRNSDMQSSSISKLSSGSRIVKASDDAASLAVGTKLKTDLLALQQASKNASQAASMLQVADGALSKISDTLLRMKSLATQANSDVLSNVERGYLNKEYQQLGEQINYIASSTKFNDIAMLEGDGITTSSAETTTLTFQVGVQAGTTTTTAGNDEIAVDLNEMTTQALGLRDTGDTGPVKQGIDDRANAQTSSADLDDAIASVNEERATLGAQMSRFEKIGENLASSIENLDAARSVLMDVDVAAEMTKFSTNQVRTQAATAMLAQANQLPQNLMKLLQ